MTLSRTWQGWLTIILIVAVPLFLWLLPYSFDLRLGDGLAVNAGKALGIVGFCLFAVNILLASRHPFLERLFFGLDKVYRAHHLIGAVTMVAVLYHPLLMTTRYLGNLNLVAEFLLPFYDAGRTFGLFALVIAEAILFATIFLKLRYDRWKRLHIWLGLAFILVYFHIFIIEGDIAANPALKAYLVVLGGVAVSAMLWRALARRWLAPRAHYRLERVRPLSPAVTQLVLAPLGSPLAAAPGQFAFLTIEDKAVTRESHPFTITSIDDNGRLTFSIKALGDYTSSLPRLKPGADVLLEGGFGRFSYRAVAPRQQIWVAGGIGITPFVSLARTLPRQYRVTLYYSVSNRTEAVLLEQFPSRPNFKVVLWPTDQKGYLTVSSIAAAHSPLTKSGFLLCGPPTMQQALYRQLRAKGVPAANIYREVFSLK